MIESISVSNPCGGQWRFDHFCDCPSAAHVPFRIAKRAASVDSLAAYYRYLQQNLGFPFRAWYPEPTLPGEGEEYPCAVLGLVDPRTGPGDEIDGIYCTVAKGEYERVLPLVELELPEEDWNFALVEQYGDWFCKSALAR